MQPGSPPEDLHDILSRFSNWAGKQPGDGDGNGHTNGAPAEGIREIPYEEAIRQHRSRQAARASKRSAAAPAESPAPSIPARASAATPEPQPTSPEMPSWIAALDVIAETEPRIELKAAPPGGRRAEPHPAAPALSTATMSAPPPQRARRPSPLHRAPTPKAPKAGVPAQMLTAPLPDPSAEPPAQRELPVQTYIDLPQAPLAARHRPPRRTPPAPPKTATAAAGSAAPPKSAPPKSAPPKAALPKVASAPAKPAPARAIVAKTSPSAPLAAKPAAALLRRHAGKTSHVASKSAVSRSGAKTRGRRPVQAGTTRRDAAASPAKRRARSPKRPHFSQILAHTVRQPKAALAPKKKPAPDRTCRITTRFSPAEERRIEKCATELGITVSAYLRQCALSIVAHNSSSEIPLIAPALSAGHAAPRQSAPALSSHAAPAPSLVGGWLSLLRNRFLGPPIRFTEEA